MAEYKTDIAERVVNSLVVSLKAREPWDGAWKRALIMPTPIPEDWLKDVADDPDEPTETPLEFLERVCKANYEFRLAELQGEVEGLIPPPIYPIFSEEGREYESLGARIPAVNITNSTRHRQNKTFSRPMRRDASS